MNPTRRFFTAVLIMTFFCSSATPGFSQSTGENSTHSPESREEEQQEGESTEESDREGVGSEHTLPDIVITSSRTRKATSETTRSTTVIDREQIEKQSGISRDIGDILGKTVPGMGTSTEGLTNFTQKLRGRKFLVMVDGIPISTPLRDGARDLKVIDSESIDRVEIVRGGTSVYGFGATGGVVNYITRKPEEEQVRGYAKTGFRFSTPHPDRSLQWNSSLGVSERMGDVDYLFNASGGDRNFLFDRYGNRLPSEPLPTQGGLGETDEWSVLTKFGREFDENRQRVEVMFSNYDIQQNTELTVDPGNPPDESALGVHGTPPGDDVETENELLRAGYTHRDLHGSQLDIMAYHQDYLSRFGVFAAGTASEGQSTIKSEKVGARFTVNTPLVDEENGPQFIWGTDLQNDKTSQKITGPLTSLPQLNQDAYAGFAQLEWPFEEVGHIRTGLRHEEFKLEVSDFPSGSGTVEGGTLYYDETLFNLTGVLYLSEHTETFGGFSQGFSLADVGRAIRNIPAGDDVESVEPPGQTVDNYEIGVRGSWEQLSGSLVGFFSESDLGSTFDAVTLELQRQPQEIWGVETQIDYDFNDRWTAGGTGTWTDSRADLDGGGSLNEELPIANVPPYKLTGYVEFQPFEGWNNRLQFLHSGDRDPDAPGAFGNSEIDSFTLFDLEASYDLNPGTLQLGVENLFNEDYFPVASQMYGKDEDAPVLGGFTRGQGRTVSLNYSIKW